MPRTAVPAGGEPSLAVRELLAEAAAGLELRLVAGEAGLGHLILLPRVQRPGLALTGYTDYIRYGRVQILGGSEMGYLHKLPARQRATALAKLAGCRLTCFVVTKGLAPPTELLEQAEARGIPVLATPTESTPFIKKLTAYLDERLAVRLHLHSVLMDVFGLGVLITGESGIGKSECALDLLDRGHRLVADDVVELKRMGETLVGSCPELTRDHMELRGLGVINIKDLYGVSSIRLSQGIELIVNLERWDPAREYERLGLGGEAREILGVRLPQVRMPVAPGRNTAILVEVAARNHLLKGRGYDAARRFADRVDELMQAGDGPVTGRPSSTRRRSRGRRPRKA